jgi:hypothetical protein
MGRSEDAVALTRPGRLAFLAVLLCLLVSLQARAQGQPTRAAAWVHLIAANDLPPPRVQYGMATDGAGNLYAFGGTRGGGIPTSDFWVWHTRDHTWRELASGGMPSLIEPHLAVDGTGAVYEFGGIGKGGAHNFSADGHGFGLYRYDPHANRWSDLTPEDAQPNVDWPLGREDFGFAYVPTDNALWVFAGEGPGNASLADMWRYDLGTRRWSRVYPRFTGGAGIDAREIYAITYDGHGGLYLFGGAYVFGPDQRPLRWQYVNDLWRFDVAARRWTLQAGRANAYDPTMPMPRHYYGQACDAAGNFYVLGGYLSSTVDESGSPPYFASDLYGLYAQVVAFANDDAPTGDIAYAVGDFWQFDAQLHRWHDLSSGLGDLGPDPFIPYVMVADPTGGALLTFGGYHTGDDGLLAPSAEVWSYTLPPSGAAIPASAAGAAPTPTSTP